MVPAFEAEDGTMVKGQAGSAQRKPRQEPQQAGAEKVENAAPANGAEPEEDQEYVELTSQTVMQMKTMRGDLAQAMVDFIKNNFQDQPWGKFSEHRQRSVIDACQRLAGKLVHEAVRLAKLDDTQGPIPMMIGGCSIDVEKGLVLKVTMTRDDDTLKAVNHALGKGGFFIPYNAEDFMGQRKTIEPDNVGDLGIPKQPLQAVKGHAITMSVVGEGEDKTSVASCECNWASKLPISEIEMQPKIIEAHLNEARLGRGPLDDKGNPIAGDPKTGEVTDKSPVQAKAEANQAMPGDIGPETPPAAPADDDEGIPPELQRNADNSLKEPA